MTIIDPKKIEPLKNARKPFVDATCIGCCACISISGNVFEMDDLGYSHAKDLPSYDENNVNDSIAACPVKAISWIK